MSKNILHHLLTDFMPIFTIYSACDIGRSNDHPLRGNDPDKYTVSISIYIFRIHSTGNTSHPYFYRATMNGTTR